MIESTEIKLTWEDLILDNVTGDEAAAWLLNWDWLVSGDVCPIFLSRFGNWFLRRLDGSTDLLDVIDGKVETISTTPEGFVSAVNTQDWQEQYLYSALVMKYRREGIVARGRDAIAFVPHPAFVESLGKCKVMVVTMNVWQSICGQIAASSR
jgi:hypothetical protein